jgi:hypothetical protein
MHILVAALGRLLAEMLVAILRLGAILREQ